MGHVEPRATGQGGLQQETAAASEPILIAGVISFQNEAGHLPSLLRSLDAQTEPADQLLFVDDGSNDDSPSIIAEYASARSGVRVLTRERRASVRDRLADAPELTAFVAGVATLAEPWDVVAKIDGDLELSPTLFADVRGQFRADPGLGITGSYLCVIEAGGARRREEHPEYHVRGPNKFYRRACYEQITPLPIQLGWDTVDDLRARAGGWRTRSFAAGGGDTVHLRRTGSHDGRLRAFRRWGLCAWAYGAHPLAVALGAVKRATMRPYVLGGLSYLWGWAAAGVSGYPRVEPETRAFARREDLARIAALARRVLRVRSDAQLTASGARPWTG
jgi:biofilm PGA synthesis N-glycosyltransferase PgaC